MPAWGRIVVADSAPAAGKAEAFNRMERLRDPSHVRALPLEEPGALFRDAGLAAPRVQTDRLPGELEGLLERSFPRPADADRLRKMFAESLEEDDLGMETVRKDGRILFSFPILLLAACCCEVETRRSHECERSTEECVRHGLSGGIRSKSMAHV